MSKQRGFSIVEGLLIVLFLTIIGASGWYAANRDNVDVATNTLESTSIVSEAPETEELDPKLVDPAESVPEGIVSYEDISIAIPESWKVEDNSTEERGLSLVITSPDFVETPDSVYGGTDQGVLIRITQGLANGDEKIDAILNGVDVLSENRSEVSKELSINGRRGVSYGIGYEGPPSYTTIIDADIGYFAITYTDAPYTDNKTNIKTAKYYDAYMTLVNSFKVK